MFRSSLLAGFFVGLTIHLAAAQEPTQAQRDAIRSACRSDFIAHCSSVQPGGKDALECLLRNESKLSTSCKTAVSAVAPKTEAPPAATATPAPAEPVPTPAAAPPAAAETPPPASPVKQAVPTKKTEVTRTSAAPSAPASGKPTAKQTSAIRAACRSDFISNCAGVQPGAADALECLQRNSAKLSKKCQTAVAAIGKGPAPVAATGGNETPAPAAPAPAPAAAAPAKPTTQQTSAIRAACRSDFMSHCSGVQPGGAEALQCLQTNAASLSPACKSAVAAVGGPAASATAEPPSSTPAAPAVAPLGPMPPMRPRRALAILALCSSDQQTLCAGVPPGGGRIIDCLASNAPRLTPGCYDALARASR